MTDLLPAEPVVTDLVSVDSQCAGIEVWAATCDSVPELRDATNKLAAIDEYLSRTSTEGRSRVAAAMRRLEVRIGELLPDAEVGSHSSANEGTDLTPNQRHDFRQMAAHPEIVEEVIAESSDDRPASRRKVLNAMPNGMRRSPQAPVDDRLRHVAEEVATTVRLAADQPWTEIGPEAIPALLRLLEPSRTTLSRIINEIKGAVA